LQFGSLTVVYIYEIDENGQKINEIKHFFEKGIRIKTKLSCIVTHMEGKLK